LVKNKIRKQAGKTNSNKREYPDNSSNFSTKRTITKVSSVMY